MKTITQILLITAILLLNNLFAQDTTFIKLAEKHAQKFSLKEGKFTGSGWDEIVRNVKRSQNILIGEDHFSNEIPKFIGELVKTTDFDNFYIEVDPYSTKIIESSIKNLSPEELQDFNTTYGERFSFYSLIPEYDLLTKMVKSGTKLLGADQIVGNAEALIFQDLIKRTASSEAKKLYKEIIQKSKTHLELFYENPENPMFFLTPEFSDILNKLLTMNINDEERTIINDMQLSVAIYKEQNHKKRVNLLIRQLMKDYPIWKDKKNLFKYGANHLTRGESFSTVFDIGNVIANLTESVEKESFHMMIVGEKGTLGRPLKNFPYSKIDINKSFYLKFLKPFFTITQGNEYYLFNLRPLKKALYQNKLKINDQNLERTIKGYDALIIIPDMTPAEFHFMKND